MVWDPTKPEEGAPLLSAPVRENFEALDALMGAGGMIPAYPLLAPDGLVGAASYAFAGAPGTGLSRGAVVGELTLAVNGKAYGQLYGYGPFGIFALNDTFLTFVPGNAKDLGQPGAEPRSVYAGTSFLAPNGVPGTSPLARGPRRFPRRGVPLPRDTGAAPAYSVAADPTVGFSYFTGEFQSGFVFSDAFFGPLLAFGLTGGGGVAGMTLPYPGSIGWAAGLDPTEIADVMLGRGENTPGRLAVRSYFGPTSLALDALPPFDPDNYERAVLAALPGVGVELRPESAGAGGADLDVLITPKGTGALTLTRGAFRAQNIILNGAPLLSGDGVIALGIGTAPGLLAGAISIGAAGMAGGLAGLRVFVENGGAFLAGPTGADSMALQLSSPTGGGAFTIAAVDWGGTYLGSSSGFVAFNVAGITSWVLDIGGTFRPWAPNTYDFGDKDRPIRSLYLGTGLDVAALSSAPATPAAGRGVLYLKADKKLYLLNDAGVETPLW